MSRSDSVGKKGVGGGGETRRRAQKTQYSDSGGRVQCHKAHSQHIET